VDTVPVQTAIGLFNKSPGIASTPRFAAEPAVGVMTCGWESGVGRWEAESSAPMHGSEVQYAKRGSNMSELGRADRHLILISGAVASGKTTLALSLAGLARMRGIPAASIDIDELVVTVAGPDWSLVTRTDRLFACELAGVLTERLFDRGERLVAIAGSTLSSYEWQHVVTSLSQATRDVCPAPRVP
jgi:hypothetical protein